MESFFQIILALGGAHSAHCFCVSVPCKARAVHRDPRDLCRLFRQHGGLVIPSLSDPLRAAGHRDQDVRHMVCPQLPDKSVQGAGHLPPVVVGVLPPSFIFKAVQRARDAPVAEGRRSSVIDMLLYSHHLLPNLMPEFLSIRFLAV